MLHSYCYLRLEVLPATFPHPTTNRRTGPNLRQLGVQLFILVLVRSIANPTTHSRRHSKISYAPLHHPRRKLLSTRWTPSTKNSNSQICSINFARRKATRRCTSSPRSSLGWTPVAPLVLLSPLLPIPPRLLNGLHLPAYAFLPKFSRTCASVSATFPTPCFAPPH